MARRTTSRVLSAWLLLTTSTACCATSPSHVPIPPPSNRPTRPTRDDVERLVEASNWVDAVRALAAAWHYIDALERDGCWER